MLCSQIITVCYLSTYYSPSPGKSEHSTQMESIIELSSPFLALKIKLGPQLATLIYLAGDVYHRDQKVVGKSGIYGDGTYQYHHHIWGTV